MLEARGKPREARPCSRSRNMMATVRSHGLEETEPRVTGGSYVLPPRDGSPGAQKAPKLVFRLRDLRRGRKLLPRKDRKAGREVRGNDY